MQKKKRVQVSNKIKLSSTVRTSLIIIAIVILAFGSGNIIKALQKKTGFITESKEVYKYTDKFNSKSKINLVDNQYVKEEEITDKQTYISDLISNIDMDLGYTYTGTKEADIVYSYKVEAVISATYLSNNKSYDVLNRTEVLMESGEKEIQSKSFSISEKVNVNYAKYHELIKDFKQDIGINANSLLYVKLTVYTRAKVDSSTEVREEYVSNYNISLGEKVAVIEEIDHDEKTDSIKYEQKTNVDTKVSKKSIAGNVIIILVGLITLRAVLKKTEVLKTIRNEFKLELNRIMRSCENKLVEIEDLTHIDIEHSTKVKDIEQLLKLSDEALVPIYCYINEESEEAYFIVTKYEKSYIYILKG